ncbi:hypothetical protein H5410_044773 [Solanum commersonii]|uniref:Uncharacterized protein n=1 Tax=Solanum commersonii TaxID=4109 RepID=A0A9J5X7W3_SOLCO|nr:hypothetical protein H5410_044773 [Solanum commersonii]
MTCFNLIDFRIDCFGSEINRKRCKVDRKGDVINGRQMGKRCHWRPPDIVVFRRSMADSLAFIAVLGRRDGRDEEHLGKEKVVLGKDRCWEEKG